MEPADKHTAQRHQPYVSMEQAEAAFSKDVLGLVERLKAAGDKDGADVVRRLQGRLEHTESWYGARLARLFHWAHDELTESQKDRYFNIVANGTADVMETPVYAQQLNAMRHRAERAERELAALRAKHEESNR